MFCKFYQNTRSPGSVFRAKELIRVSLINRMAQYYALSTFLPPFMPTKLDSGPTLQHWLRAVVARIWPGVVAILMVLRLLLVANLLVRPEDLEETHARRLFGIAFILAFAHLPVAPKMVKLESRMRSPESKPDDMALLLSAWLKINNLRLWIVDVPFFFVTSVAAMESLSVLKPAVNYVE